MDGFSPKPATCPKNRWSCSLMAIASLWISQATPADGYLASLFGPLLLFGLGAGPCFLPLSITILGGVPRDDAGAASGMLQTMQQTGGALGVAALTSVATAHGRSTALLMGTETVKTHLSRTYAKLHVDNRTQLASLPRPPDGE